MKKSKKIAWELAKELSAKELADKNATEEYIRLVAGKSEAFAADVFDAGVKAITSQCQKIAAGYQACRDIYREEAGQIGVDQICEYTRLCRELSELPRNAESPEAYAPIQAQRDKLMARIRELRSEMGLDQDEPAGGNRTGSEN